MTLAGGEPVEDVVDPLGHEDEGLELGARLERVQGLDPAQDVRDPVDPGAERGGDQVVAEALLLQDEAQAAGEEVQAGGLDRRAFQGQLVAVGRQDAVEEEREGKVELPVQDDLADALGVAAQAERDRSTR